MACSKQAAFQLHFYLLTHTHTHTQVTRCRPQARHLPDWHEVPSVPLSPSARLLPQATGSTSLVVFTGVTKRLTDTHDHLAAGITRGWVERTFLLWRVRCRHCVHRVRRRCRILVLHRGGREAVNSSIRLWWRRVGGEEGHHRRGRQWERQWERLVRQRLALALGHCASEDRR